MSIQCSIKFDPDEMDVYLPHNVLLEGEKAKIEQSIVPSSLVQPPVDPLRENFEQLPSSDGHPKCIQTESAAICCLQTGEGVISDLSWECGQLPKGIQEDDIVRFVEESSAELDPCSVMAAVAVVGVEADDLEPSYDEACQWSD